MSGQRRATTNTKPARRRKERKMAHSFIAPEAAKKARRMDGRRSRRMNEYDELMLAVVENAPQILRIEAEAGDTARAIRLRVAQSVNRVEKAGKIAGRLSAWTGEDGAVYVQHVVEVPTKNGASPEPAPETAEETAPETAAPARATRR